jgi:TM2 domain
MRGKVLGVDVRTGEGLVAGDDGRRYRFAQGDWATRGEPAVGMAVDFEAADDRALSVFPMPGERGAVTLPPKPEAPVTDRNKLVAALLGTLGIHRFYLGRTGSGVVMLILSITIIGLFVTGIWALVDTIRYLIIRPRIRRALPAHGLTGRSAPARRPGHPKLIRRRAWQRRDRRSCRRGAGDSRGRSAPRSPPATARR